MASDVRAERQRRTRKREPRREVVDLEMLRRVFISTSAAGNLSGAEHDWRIFLKVLRTAGAVMIQ